MASSAPVPGDGEMRLRLASYNVHRCVGSDGAHHPDRVAEVLREIDADIVGLQEVDSGFEPRFGVDQLDRLATRMGMEAIEGPTLLGANGNYGNALLTRLPVRSVRRLDLSFRRRERRGALDVDVTTPAGTVRTVVTHFGLHRRERAVQAVRLARHLVAEPRPVTVLLGDFNEWRPLAGALRSLEDLLGRAPRLRSFPARWPLLALDRIWVSPAAALESIHTHPSALACVASDHLPVVANLRWRTSDASAKRASSAAGFVSRSSHAAAGRGQMRERE